MSSLEESPRKQTVQPESGSSGSFFPTSSLNLCTHWVVTSVRVQGLFHRARVQGTLRVLPLLRTYYSSLPHRELHRNFPFLLILTTSSTSFRPPFLHGGTPSPCTVGPLTPTRVDPETASVVLRPRSVGTGTEEADTIPLLLSQQPVPLPYIHCTSCDRTINVRAIYMYSTVIFVNNVNSSTTTRTDLTRRTPPDTPITLLPAESPCTSDGEQGRRVHRL